MQKMQDVLIKHNLLCLNGIKMGFTNCRLNMQNIHYLVFLVLFLYFGKITIFLSTMDIIPTFSLVSSLF